MENEKLLLEEIVAKIKEAHGLAGNLKGKGTLEIITTILGVLPDVIKEVEIIGDKLSSADKKELAIEACLTWANCPVLPDSIERQLLGLIIDFVISLLNKWLGNAWLGKVTGFLSKVWSVFKKIF